MEPSSKAERRGTRTEVVRLRLDPDLADRIADVRKEHKISTEADTLRLLLDRGIKSVRGVETAQPKQPLRRDQYAERAAAHVEALGDLLTRIESHDAEGAVMLADLLAKSTRDYAHDLKKRVEQ